MSETEIKDRILKFLTHQRLSSSKFADVIGVQRSSISHLLSGRNNPGLDFLQKVLTNFPMLSPDWLVMGIGEMFKESNQSQLKFELKQENPSHGLAISPLSQETNKVTVPEEIQNPPANFRAIKKIVVFYDDNSFEELKPKKKNIDG